MAASKADVDGWIKEAKKLGATHIISVCDTFDYSDYPSYVMPGESLEERVAGYRNAPMQRINEVIDIAALEKEEHPPVFDEEKIIKNFCGYELHDYEMFKKSHVCPDRTVHDNVPFKVTLSFSCASAIGSNVYVKCERCGTMQDITDYSEW